jgi:hypothetical protein
MNSTLDKILGTDFSTPDAILIDAPMQIIL